MRSFLVWLVLLGLSELAYAVNEPAGIQVDQTRAALPDISVYLDVYDAIGNPLTNIKASQLSAKIGDKAASVASSVPFAKSNEGVAYIFLVDISRSLKPGQFGLLKKSVDAWIDTLGTKDRAAVITLGNDVKVVADFSADKKALKAKMDGLKDSDNSTRLYDGVERALDLGRRTDTGLPARRAIITLSDGLDDVAGGTTLDEVMKRINEDRVPIYAIGYTAPPVTSKKEAGLKVLGSLAHASGGEYLAAGAESFEALYQRLHKRIDDVLAVGLRCDECLSDGGVSPLEITLRSGSRILTAPAEVRMIGGTHPKTRPGNRKEAFYAGGAAAFLLVVFVAYFIRRRVTKPPSAEVPEIPAPVKGAAGATAMHGNFASKPKSEPPEERISIVLTAVSGVQRGRQWRATVGGRTILGRSAECEVVIDGDGEISSRHCVLYCERSKLFVQDNQSTNGTNVNGVPIKVPHLLTEGDLILLGRTELRIHLEKEVPR